MFFGSDGVKYKPIADKDREVIPVQLGREARGVLGISRRCAYGFPQVIVNRPVTLEIADITVFPTLFWLTCPYLRKAVSRLESEGWISRFEERLETDPAFAEQVADDHATHAETRLFNPKRCRLAWRKTIRALQSGGSLGGGGQPEPRRGEVPAHAPR